jgi:anthranilate phosphoribosyltransferase
LTGIAVPERLDAYAEVMAALGRRRAWIICGEGPMDEISISGPTEVRVVEPGESGAIVRRTVIDPAELGVNPAPLEALQGGDREANAAILLGVLAGKDQGPRAEMVALNAAAGFCVAGVTATMAEGLAMARDILASGAGLRVLEKLIRASGSPGIV